MFRNEVVEPENYLIELKFFDSVSSLKNTAIHISHCTTEAIVDMLSKMNSMMSEKMDNQFFSAAIAYLKQYTQDVLDCILKVSTWVDDLVEESSIIVSQFIIALQELKPHQLVDEVF